MVFQTDGNLQRAQALITAGDTVSLQYAALELRLALEKLSYRKLSTRLDSVPYEDLRKWQPKRVIETLSELVDPDIDKNASFRFSPEDAAGNPTTSHYLGEVRGVNEKDVGAHWQKLGSILHAKMPKVKSESVPEFSLPIDPEVFLQGVLDYIRDLTSPRFDAHFANSVTFECVRCDKKIVRTEKALKEGDLVTCQDPSCGAIHVTSKVGSEFTFQLHQITIKCTNCDETGHVDADRILNLPKNEPVYYRCECGSRYTIGWRLQYSPAPDTTPGDASASVRNLP
jgi:hypothetical protein